uniref:Protein BatD n=1 Tax=uncultured Acidobacteriota bacterium TaxID=171953 RepID=Q7X319_9BACT|nr:hypothetical protein [uncultured Acidobacteriota bacterium]
MMCAASSFALGAQPSSPIAAAMPVVHAGVDRTAMWVADRVTYTVTIVCPPGVEILLDDVAKEKLKANGFDIVSGDTAVSSDGSGRTTHELRFVLTTYRVDMPSLSIEPIQVRYYARVPGAPRQDVAPAGELLVPGAAVALRSTLPEGQSDYELRDGRPAASRPAFATRAQPAGIALVVMSIAPAAFGALQLLRRRRVGRPAGRSMRTRRQEQQAALARLGSLETSSEADRRRAYDEVSGALKAYLEARTGLPAAALTTAEIEAALAEGGGELQRERIGSLLAACDAARYAAPEEMPSAEACSEVVSAAAQVLRGR